ncbi:MAG: metal ABC transporter substrate-binding protein, partial [Oscillospiraceae bacterium]|nr:metal ABC transporter substrate-binding protein [Oscillospiraceae bacterium]
MKLNKIIAALASMLMLLTFTVSCESGDNGSGGTNTGTSSQDTQNNGTDTQSPDPNTTNTSTFKIVSTTFPQYDWIREIIGDKAGNFELTLLADSAVDLHSYVPSISDIAKISDCDMFIFTGGESDEWAEDILESAGNSDTIIINLVEELGDKAKIEEIVEGMEHDDHDDDHDGHDDDDHDDHDEEIDEHVWLSLRNAQLFCEVIAEQISVLDPENADLYESNMTAYNQKLAALDSEYKEMRQSAKTDTLLFADRFPFRYLVDDYELN